MMRVLGSDRRWPSSPAASSRLAIDAACPMQMVLIGFRRYCEDRQLSYHVKLKTERLFRPFGSAESTYLHCVVDCQAGSDLPAGRVDVHADLQGPRLSLSRLPSQQKTSQCCMVCAADACVLLPP